MVTLTLEAGHKVLVLLEGYYDEDDPNFLNEGIFRFEIHKTTGICLDNSCIQNGDEDNEEDTTNGCSSITDYDTCMSSSSSGCYFDTSENACLFDCGAVGEDSEICTSSGCYWNSGDNSCTSNNVRRLDEEDDEDDAWRALYREECRDEVYTTCIIDELQGWCYSGRSTVAVRSTASAMAAAARGRSMVVHKPISELKVGDEIVKKPATAVGEGAGSMEFTKVLALPRSETTQEMYKISFFPDTNGKNAKEVKKLMHSNGNLRRVADDIVLESTENHKFLRCKQSKAPKEMLVASKDLKRGE